MWTTGPLTRVTVAVPHSQGLPSVVRLLCRLGLKALNLFKKTLQAKGLALSD